MNLETLLRTACEERGWSLQPSVNENFLVKVPTEDGREQDVEVFRYEEDGEALLGFQTVIGPALGLLDDKPMLALKMNHEFRHGALAIDEGDDLVMVEKLPEDKVDPPACAAVIRYLARRGDMIEKYVFERD